MKPHRTEAILQNWQTPVTSEELATIMEAVDICPQNCLNLEDCMLRIASAAFFMDRANRVPLVERTTEADQMLELLLTGGEHRVLVAASYCASLEVGSVGQEFAALAQAYTDKRKRACRRKEVAK